MSSCFNRRSSSPVLSLLTAAILLAAAPVMTATAAEPAPRSHGNYTFSIEQQPLVSALNAFTAVTGWQVGLPAELGQGVSSPGVSGPLSPEKALDRLLVGTNLSYRKLGSNSIVLEKRAAGGALNLQQVTISATRNEQDVSSVPSTVSVHEREALDRQNVNTIRELVRYEPGVSVGGAGTRAGNAGFNIRGIDGDRILTQVDGVEVPDNFFNGPYAKTRRNYVDPEIVKRVEILRGPASALYGSSAIGGAVSYFTLDPDDIIKPGQDVGARLKTGYSSADESWLTSGTVAGRVQDVDGLLHLSQRNGHEMESYDGNNATGLARTGANPEDARTTNILAKLGWNYGDDNRLGLTYEKYKDDRDTNLKNAVGGPFNAGPFVSNWYRARTGNDTITRERFGLENSIALESPIADRIKTSLNYQIAKTDQTTAEIYQPSRRVLRTRETLYQERQWVFDAQLDKAFSVGETDHHVTYGTTLKQQKVTGSREGAATCLAVGSGCTAIGAPSPSAGDSVRKASDFPDPTINTYSLFAQDQIAWNNWTFLPSVRYDYTQLKPKLTEDFLNATDPTRIYPHDDSTKTWHRVSPKFGLTYALTDHYTWFGQYAEGFRTPSAKALYGRFENLQQGYVVEPNPDLKPETSKGIETGIRGNFDAGNFDVAVFYNKYKDFIDEDNTSVSPTGTIFQPFNIKRATIKGIEAKGRMNLDAFGAPQGLYTQGAVAYAYGRNDETGQPLNSVNPLKGVFGLGYDQEQYGALVSWTLVKKQNRVDKNTFFSPDGNTTSAPFKTPGFGIVDLTGFYKVTHDVTVNGGLYNLTDKKYWNWDDVRSYDGVGEAGVTSPANLDRLTQPGRNFAINVIWDI
ncbi:TonB-dependent hemoglobin/transferrin/lactoferrin family receptor [Pseudomonas sp. MAFF 311095]|uniref:TonB-dependent hemoglobin/transferrin/lactoferrin family receptor n=1 Tax=Pseudomonas petroselini TaxID=2899822 RepID=A0ABS8QR88_9PSED|nr:TonB-dependent receptor [Pseudomonas petroselini]MCD7038201.1 TonB-dependent hemoglobin/transferrin/lactoferrin family receptor [Pseudomonas petroselini]MCD7045066.1 TonB-dependent hemoglobin/transferrin/lactoferrin family receptor [Pseudomonas petroselini]MCD7068908.1 TonB-dependent hemoglobin/transferrin/lactoferrin family receptor [Pseudomonas petroselini]MCD7079962.1 TonB-dependent hemoglobin/transferrin/lactoferrin family receptor [Pseudomonas petroselini]